MADEKPKATAKKAAAKPKAKNRLRKNAAAKKAASNRKKLRQKTESQKSRRRKKRPRRNRRPPKKHRETPKRAPRPRPRQIGIAQFRDSLEHSVTLSRERIQEVVDDAVKRGRMTHGDAEKMIGELLKRGRKQTDALLSELEKLRPPGAQETPLVESGTDTEAAPKRAPRKGERLEVEIDSLAFGGRGIARADGFVVFVAGGLPGDRVLAEVTKGKKRFAEARTIELLRAGADRLPDRCVHGGEPCPGAPWQGLAYERQLAEKQAQVEDALRRIGGLDDFEMEPIVGALEEWRYRNKLEYSFGAGAVGHRRRGRRARLPRARPLGPDRRRRRLQARQRSRQRGPQRGARMGADGGRRRLRRAGAARRAAQPRRPRGPADRPDPDPPGDHRGRACRGRRSTSTRRSRATPAAPTARPGRSAKSACTRSSAGSSSRCRTAPSSRPTPRWPSASTRWRPSSPASPAASASSTSSAGSARSA